MRAMGNERAKKLCKAANELRAHDYLVIVGKSWITLTVRNGQYFWSYGWQDTQTLDICESVDVIEKLRFVKSE